MKKKNQTFSPEFLSSLTSLNSLIPKYLKINSKNNDPNTTTYKEILSISSSFLSEQKVNSLLTLNGPKFIFEDKGTPGQTHLNL